MFFSKQSHLEKESCLLKNGLQKETSIQVNFLIKTEKDSNYWYIVPSPGNPNVTFLNNKPLNAKTAVKDGDVVAVGNPQTMKTAGPMRVGFI